MIVNYSLWYILYNTESMTDFLIHVHFSVGWCNTEVIALLMFLCYSTSQWFLFCCVLFLVKYTQILPIFFRIPSLTLWQSYNCPSANLKGLDRSHNPTKKWYYKQNYKHNKTKCNKTVYIFLVDFFARNHYSTPHLFAGLLCLVAITVLQQERND